MNIIKHAKAKSVIVIVTANAKELSITVRDDGVGIDEKRIETPQSHGLLGMRHRIESLDGKLTVRTLGAGVGTECSFSLPLERIQNTGT
jgi:signal transduction histidine kinase